jgi:hypothetical protein
MIGYAVRIILIFSSLFIFFFPRPAFSEEFYTYDVRPYFFSRWCYSTGQCSLDAPPPGKTFAQLVDDFDRLVFLVSLQGLVNREASRFVLISYAGDEKWISELQKAGLFPSVLVRKDLGSLDEVISTFKPLGVIEGSVVWEASKPYTLDLAFTISGAENLVIVRKGSSLYSKITQAFPVKIDLTTMNFANKDSAYRWLVDNYLSPGKASTTLFLIDDGWPVYKYLFLNKAFLSADEVINWNLLGRDLGVAKRAFFFDLGIHPQMQDPIERVVGKDYQTLSYILNAIVGRIGGSGIFESWGWPPAKYMIYGCGGGDAVSCGEWYWVQRIAEFGGVQRFGGAEMYAAEPANLSFYQHFKADTSFCLQPPPLSIKDMFDKEYIIGFPLNYSFEQDFSGAPWVLETTNRSIYEEPWNSSHGKRFLQVNVSQQDVGKSIYQDFQVNLMRGYRYQFVIHFRSPEGALLKGRQVVWGFTNDGTSHLLGYNQFERNNTTYQPLICEFDVKMDGLTKVRIQVYIDTAGHNYSFDEAYFFGPNSYVLNTGKKFLLLYQGDDDMVSAPYVIRTNVYPYTWYDKAQNIPTAWGFTAEVAKVVPAIWEYFVRTKDEKRTFVMPDSGLGYANIIPMPSTHLDSFIKETARYQRKFQYRTGWDLEGFRWSEVPSSSKVALYGKKVSPEGIFYNAPQDYTRTIKDGLAVVPMVDFSYAGDDIETQAQRLKEIVQQMSNYEKKFLVLRNIFVSDKHLEDIINRAYSLGAEFEVVDPITFFYLFKLSFGEYPKHRLSVVSHNLPSSMKRGTSCSFKIVVRNDGWAIWTPSGMPVDGSGGGDYKLAYGWQMKEQFTPSGKGVPANFPYNYRANISHAVFPGESIDVEGTLTAPSERGEYVVQFDGVKEYFEFFETDGNVPWIKEIKVTLGDAQDVKAMLSKYLTSDAAMDLNHDGEVNMIDFGEMIR